MDRSVSRCASTQRNHRRRETNNLETHTSQLLHALRKPHQLRHHHEQSRMARSQPWFTIRFMRETCYTVSSIQVRTRSRHGPRRIPPRKTMGPNTKSTRRASMQRPMQRPVDKWMGPLTTVRTGVLIVDAVTGVQTAYASALNACHSTNS